MRKRNHVVPVRLNAKELRHLDGQVAKSGLSREEFLRSLILGAQLQTKPCEQRDLASGERGMVDGIYQRPPRPPPGSFH